MVTLGALAALMTAFSWAFASVLLASVTKVIGVHVSIMLRQIMATIFLFLLSIIFDQTYGLSYYGVALAIFSGIIGPCVSDWSLFESVKRIGIRPAFVCSSLSTCFTALFGTIFLQEYLGIQGTIGVLVATTGVMLVIISERRHAPIAGADALSLQQQWVGIGLGLFSAATLAITYVGTKEALNTGIPPLFLAAIRNGAASLVLSAMALRLHRFDNLLTKLKENPRTAKLLLISCLSSSVLGMWLLCVSLKYAPANITATFVGLMPVALLLISGIAERRVPSLGCIIGSCVACIGAATLLLR